MESNGVLRSDVVNISTLQWEHLSCTTGKHGGAQNVLNVNVIIILKCVNVSK